ncbi:MAG TPA: SPOR domain-containing protein [Leadbetterella sp.]|nr:SPOR domain-containing protein [Leadbetterella sp.]
MLNIQQEIQSIIEERDFIVLPSIGAFLTEYTKPYFDKKGQIVLPEKKIVFNQLIDRDVENKLLHSIARNNNISVDSVQSEYYSFLVKFRAEIVLNQRFKWEQLGTFHKNEKQELVFFPEKKIAKPESQIAFEENETLYFSDIKEDIASETAETSYPQKKKSYLKSLLYAIPLVLITTTLAYTIFIKPSKNRSEKKNLVEEIDSLAEVQETVLSEPSESIQEKKEEKKTKKEDRKENESSSDASEERRGENHIVGIGIFKVKDNVDNLAAYLAENGIPAKVRRSGNKYRLFVTASSPEQANEFVQKIEQLTGEKAVYENN